MELDEIKQRLAAVEGELKRWGLDLGESFGNLDRAPSATCVQAGVVIEQMLRDLWKRLKLKGSPDRKQFEDLLTLTSKKLEDDGAPVPIAILADIRDIQARRNQAAHHWNVNRRVAVGILGSLADVMAWYFTTFLPSREDGPSQGKEGSPPEQAVIPKREATRAPEPNDTLRLDSDRGPEKTPRPEAIPTEIRPADPAPLPTEAPSLRSLVTAPAVVVARSRLRRFGLVALASALVLLACLLVVPGLLPAPAASPVWTSRSTGMTFALIPAGDFVMGSAEGDDDEKPPHPVTISKPFYLGVHEVTQAEYQAVMGTNPSYFSAGGGGKDNVAGQSTDRHPVEQVSWKVAIAFCNELSVRDGLTPYYHYRADEGEPLGGDGYRLPTEAEWEYACRAGTRTSYSFGDDAARLGAYAWYADNSRGQTHTVGLRQPNAFGLYDMYGNVLEWCLDRYDAKFYDQPAAPDPWCSAGASGRVIRGGSWGGSPRFVRSATRHRKTPDDRFYDLGFRLARGQSGLK
jgi:formylglycine-generating enzyme required for sulfatase activity